MEFVLVVIVIGVLCAIFHVSMDIIIAAVLIFVGLLTLLFVGFFIVAAFRLMLSKKAKANFTKIDKRPNGKFNVAFYIAEGQEYPNIFPEEAVFRNKLYKKEKTYTVWIDRSRKFVFDRFAFATTVTGFIAAVAMSVAAAAAIIMFWEV